MAWLLPVLAVAEKGGRQTDAVARPEPPRPQRQAGRMTSGDSAEVRRPPSSAAHTALSASGTATANGGSRMEIAVVMRVSIAAGLPRSRPGRFVGPTALRVSSRRSLGRRHSPLRVLALLPGRSSRQAGSLRCACSGHPESGRTRFRDAAIVPDPVSILSDMRLNVRRSLSQR